MSKETLTITDLDSWQSAGRDWRQNTWATTKGALLLAAVAFASGAISENERNAKKRTFIEGAVDR